MKKRKTNRNGKKQKKQKQSAVIKERGVISVVKWVIVKKCYLKILN